MYAVIAGLSAGACGGNGTGEPFPFGVDGGPVQVGTDAPPVGQALEGTWRAASCSVEHISAVKSFAAGATSTRYSYYRDTDTSCAQPYAFINYNMTYRLGGAAPFAPGAQAIDYELRGVTLAPADAATANAYNNAAFCSFTDWAPNVAKDVAGRTCADGSFAYVGQMYFDIYKVESDRLYEGDSSSGTGETEGTRPTQLSSGYYTRM